MPYKACAQHGDGEKITQEIKMHVLIKQGVPKQGGDVGLTGRRGWWPSPVPLLLFGAIFRARTPCAATASKGEGELQRQKRVLSGDHEPAEEGKEPAAEGRQRRLATSENARENGKSASTGKAGLPDAFLSVRGEQ